jgi:hypothetical protein
MNAWYKENISIGNEKITLNNLVINQQNPTYAELQFKPIIKIEGEFWGWLSKNFGSYDCTFTFQVKVNLIIRGNEWFVNQVTELTKE